MSLGTIIIIVVLAVIVIALAVWGLGKAGFKVEKIKAILPGVLEMEASRPQKDATNQATPAETHPQVRQSAKGGKIIQSGITAPADANAEIDQQATDKGEINDSPIKLT
ncbi:MAG: hypothetical protein JXM69_15885 [Anaerolineae bacterium]|nr:hypothetical protein [Anaerolineae bacterium]